MLNTECIDKYKNLRDLLKRLEIPYKDISILLNISTKELERKIQGQDSFSLEEASRIRNYIISKVSIGYLFKKDGGVN